MGVVALKDWDAHVVDAEEVARGGGFQDLRDRIIELAAPQAGETAVDVGAGTGLLSLALARRGVRVWAIDISPSMCDYLRVKAASGGLETIETVTCSAISLPLVDECADLVVSNYCLHHLSDDDKRRALAEAYRVLRPGGRLALGDMMFAVGLGQARDRQVVAAKVRALLRKGPSGALRLSRNAARLVSGRWERPARPEWWRAALEQAGFADVVVEPLAHEGGIAVARKP